MLKTGNKTIEPNSQGSFNLNTIDDPIELKDYYFVYTTRGDRDYEDVDATIKALKDASRNFGIKVDKAT